MRRSVFWIMFLNLLRDRGAFISSFILPAMVFVIFAVIFSGTSGGAIDIKVAIADESKTPQSERLIEALIGQTDIRRVGGEDATLGELRKLVKTSIADVGLVIKKTDKPLYDQENNQQNSEAAAIQIVTDPAREIAVSILEGALQNAYFQAFPEAAILSVSRVIDDKIAPLSPEQKTRLTGTIDAMQETQEGDEQDKISMTLQPKLERVNVAGNPDVQSGMSYYAGAVAILFLLFSSVNGAMTLLEERELGLLDRLAVGPGGTRVLVDGKFIFLIIQGVIQVTIIYLVAWLVFGVDLPGNLGPWFLTTLLSAVAASGLALAFVLACSTRKQAQTLANIVILIISAIGGSMVPRFFMPDWIQDIGWLTPNTWTLEAYGAIFWRGEPIDAIFVPCVALGSAGLIGLITAHILARTQS